MFNQSLWMIVSAFCGFFLGCLMFLFYWILSSKKRKRTLRKEMNQIINQAKSKALRIERTAQTQSRDLERKMKNKIEIELRKEKKRVEDLQHQAERQKYRLEEEWRSKTEDLDDQIAEASNQKEQAIQMQTQLKKDLQKSQEALQKSKHIIENTANWTHKQAREEIQKNIEEELKQEVAPQLMKLEKKLKQESEKKAKLILSQALARFASEVSTERTTTAFPIKGNETKGKIIGREGRNIRALESSCGVDIIIDESQEAILISCFDSVRREVTVKAIEQLLEEGRINPTRIEEVVEKTKRNIFVDMAEEGKKVCFDMGVHNVRPAIIEALGSLKYRSVEGYNSLKSSKEVAQIAGFIATEMNVDQKIAKRAGLFHTIGLGVDHRLEGSIAVSGAGFLKKQGESDLICQAVLCHNGSQAAQSILDHIIQASYNLFRDRPGAKKDAIETHINRLKDMESVANSFDGIIRSFAIQTGKEIRVLVDSGKVTDEQAFMLSRDIARKIDKELDTGGQLNVQVVRECRIVEQAR